MSRALTSAPLPHQMGSRSGVYVMGQARRSSPTMGGLRPHRLGSRCAAALAPFHRLRDGSAWTRSQRRCERVQLGARVRRCRRGGGGDRTADPSLWPLPQRCLCARGGHPNAQSGEPDPLEGGVKPPGIRITLDELIRRLESLVGDAQLEQTGASARALIADGGGPYASGAGDLSAVAILAGAGSCRAYDSARAARPTSTGRPWRRQRLKW